MRTFKGGREYKIDKKGNPRERGSRSDRRKNREPDKDSEMRGVRGRGTEEEL